MTAAVSERGAASGGILADAAAARLWRAPVCAFVGAAVALGIARVVGSAGGSTATEPVSAGVAAALAAGFLAGSVLFWALGPSRRTSGHDEQNLVGLGLPLLAAVPEMVTAREHKMRGQHLRRRRMLSAAVTVVSTLAALWALSGVL